LKVGDASNYTRKISSFQAALLKWYTINGRDFPWRKSKLSSFELIIAEVLLQRTKATTVANFYLNFIADFQSWGEIANASGESLENHLRPIGLYRQRAKRLKDLAQEMVRRKGRLPTKRTELDSIPFFWAIHSQRSGTTYFQKTNASY